MPTGSDTLPATGGTNPTLTTTAAATNALVVSAGGITLRGLTVGNTTGAKIFGTAFGTLTAGNVFTPDVTLNGTGQALNLTNGAFSAASGFTSVTTTSSSGAPGINLNTIAGTISFGPTSVSNAGTQGINIAGSTMTATFGSTNVSSSTSQGILVGTTSGTINFSNTTVTGGTDGVSFQNNSGANARTFGTLNVSGGSGNAFLHGAGGGNVTVNSAANLTSTGNPLEIQNASSGQVISFAGGATVNKTTAGGAGVNLGGTNTGATLSFAALALTTSNGPGLVAVGGATINVTTGSISATGSAGQAAPAISANAITFGATFTSVSSTTSSNSGNGISLTGVLGTLTMNGGSISGAAGDAFLVSGGTANITYNGTISTSVARPINVSGKTGGTVAFGGAVSSTSNGVSLTTNTGATLNFTGGLSLSTAANTAFAATGGGMVSATQNNSTIVNTLTTTTGTALNVANTTIGASGLTFRSITSNGSGAADGIILDTTGATGSLTVTGNGGTCTSAATCTGGTISNKTGADGSTTQGTGIFLNSTSNPSFTRMQLNDFQNFAIRGLSVTGFTLANSIISGANGTNSAGSSEEGCIRFDNLFTSASFPTASIANCTISGGFADNIRVQNTSGTLNRLVISVTTIGANSTSNGNDSIHFDMNNNGTVGNLTLQDSFLTSARGDLVDAEAHNNSTMDVVLRQNKFSNNHPNIASGGGGLIIQGSDSGTTPTVTYDVSCNRFRGALGIALNIFKGNGGGTFTGTIANNFIGVAGTPLSGSAQGSGIKVSANGKGSQTVLIQNNDVREYNENGIFLQANDSQGGPGATMNATVFGNTTAAPSPCAGGCFAFSGINVDVGAIASDTNIVNVVIGSASNAAQKNDFSTGDPFNFSDVNFSKIGGAAINLSKNGSAAATPLQVIRDDNNNGATTNVAVSGTVNLVNTLPTTPPAVGSCTTPAFAGTATVEEEQVSVPAATDTTAERAAQQQAQPLLVLVPRPAPQVAQIATFTAPVAKPGAQEAKATSTKESAPPEQITAAPQVANFPLTIGTLAASKTVTITFSVTVNNPLSSSVTQISNQGTVSGTGFASVVTDDPDVVGANQPTITGVIPQPTITIKNASVPRPTSGTTTMPFSVTLSNAYTVPVTVNFQTADGTAVAGTDYTNTSGTLSFPVGVTVQTISVPILSNAAAVGDKTFTVTLSAPTNGTISGTGQATGTITAANTPGTTLISEQRTSGPGTTGTGDANDDFVEVYNNTAIPITVSASDASAGWALVKSGATCTDQPIIVGTIPNGTVIPARGHYLFVGSGYSLATYAAGNQTLTANIEDDKNVALFNTANVLNFATSTRLDAVGGDANTGSNCDLLREGSSLPTTSGSISQYSFVRKATSGTPQDTNDNATDFQLVSTTPAVAVGSTAQPGLGALGPENLGSPIQRNATVKASLVDTGAASTAPPNRVRDTTPNSCAGGANCALGTLTIRRKFTNTTGAAVTRLRFRIVDITTATAPVGTADLRALTSTDVTVTLTGGGTTLVRGLTLEQPPTQTSGGGLNSSLAAGIVTSGTPIANGASINVQFVLGVQQSGSYRFLVNVEALP